LLLTAVAAFCTTEPPANSGVLPYTKIVPYCVFLASISFSVGGLILGSLTVFIIHNATLEWYHEVRYPPTLVSRDAARCIVCYRFSGAKSLVEDADGCVEQTMMSSQPRIWATMIIASFPYLSITASTYSAAAGECFRVLGMCSNAPVRLNLSIFKGLLIAASYSEFKFIRWSCYLFVVTPLLCGLAFSWMLCMKTGSFGRLLMRS